MAQTQERKEEYGVVYRARHRDKLAVYARQWRQDNPDKSRAYKHKRRLKERYGLTPETYQQLLENHNRKCAICLSNQRLCVDHDHKTGAVRGVLCSTCNAGIGSLRDSPTLLSRAIDYLTGGPK